MSYFGDLLKGITGGYSAQVAQDANEANQQIAQSQLDAWLEAEKYKNSPEAQAEKAKIIKTVVIVFGVIILATVGLIVYFKVR